MKSYAQRYPLVGWRWLALRTWISASRAGNGDCWRGVLAASILGLAVAVHAACPPHEADGAVIRKGELLLAYRQASGAGHLPMAQHFVLEVQLCDQDRVSAARLQKVDATMPEHRHGMNYRPAITPLGGGRFRVEGMMLHMAGHWQLSFEVLAGKQNLQLTHDVQID